METTAKQSLNFIKGRYDSEVTRALITYLKARIDEVRLVNDVAVGDDILKNQGSIRELKQFLIELERKPIKQSGDGAYR